MKIENLYPTTQRILRYGDVYDEYTDLFSVGGVGVNEFYALGYINTDDLPSCFRGYSCISDGETLVFSADDQNKNLPFFYTASLDNYNSTYTSFLADGIRNGSYVRYINKLNPMYTAMRHNQTSTPRRNFYIKILGWFYNANDERLSISPDFYLLHNFGSARAFYNFLYNNVEIATTYTIDGTSIQIKFSCGDFEAGMSYKNFDNYYLRSFITGYYFVHDIRPSVIDRTVYYDTIVRDYLICSNATINYDGGALYDFMISKNQFLTTNPQRQQIYSYSGGYSALFLINQLNDNNVAYIYNGSVLAFFTQGNTASRAFARIYDVEDIKKHFALNYRMIYNTNYDTYNGYIENIVFATFVTEDDRFTSTMMTGNLTDEDYKKKLRPWQYDDDGTAVNTFDPDDIPQPVSPDNPDDPDSDTGVTPPLLEGDTISLQIDRRLGTGTNFVTMYNITATQLQDFGKILYKSFADYEPAHIDPETGAIADNFFIRLSEQVTGTLDIGAVVNFIVSVRQYPFSIATLADTSVLSNNQIYIGSGKVGIPVSSAVRILTSSISVVDAGTCTVMPATPYNDFRDYYNTTVTCFLPYCGTIEVNPIEVLNNVLHCYYAIDFYTGECTAFITVSNGTHSYLCATKNGTIGVLVPITATNSGQISARYMADNARDSALLQSAVSSLFNGAVGAYTGNLGAVGGSISNLLSLGNQQQILDADRQGRSAVLAPSLSGGSGGAAFMLPDSAYVQIRRGTYSRPATYAHSSAYPLTKSGKLVDFSGFTQCVNADLTGITATETEKNMIYDLLQSGVYL